MHTEYKYFLSNDAGAGGHVVLRMHDDWPITAMYLVVSNMHRFTRYDFLNLLSIFRLTQLVVSSSFPDKCTASNRFLTSAAYVLKINQLQTLTWCCLNSGENEPTIPLRGPYIAIR